MPKPGSDWTAIRHPRRIAIVAFPDVEALDVVGPAEVFAAAAALIRERCGRAQPAYSIELCAARRGRIVSSSGVELYASRSLDAVAGPLDTLVIAGGEGVTAAMRDARLLGWIRRTARHARRICSVCAGAFLLAEAGLLRGRRATTHWRLCDELAERHPDVSVERDPIFLRDGNVFTSAGVTAGIDLALALVELDHGRGIALAVARELVMFLKRPGGQSQFSVQLRSQEAEREPLRQVQSWIADNPGSDLSVETLARRAAMSPRNFSRVFKRETGATPGTFVALARVEQARRRLEESSDGVESIAAECGFGTGESMRRAFLRTLKVPPAAYRERFRRPEPSTNSVPAH